MNRYDFSIRRPDRIGIFWPSVNEIWRDTRDGSELLLHKIYEPEGFYCVGYNRDFTLNFNCMPDDWFQHKVYVKTINRAEAENYMESKKNIGWF